MVMNKGSRGQAPTPSIYVDLLKTDADNAVRLVTLGTKEDLQRFNIELREGLILPLYTDDGDDEGRRDDLVFTGVAHFNAEIGEWVARIDWHVIRHVSDKSAQD